MRSSTVSETLPGVDESLYSAQITVGAEVEPEEVSLPGRNRAARGILTGILLGAGAWGAIWVVASALLRHRG
ncbi:MAG: hypothetical protein ABSB23_17655 [Bryobacteraceae bacterium]|jgi:hypothetical protein